MIEITDLAAAQRHDDRPLYAPLRSDDEWPPRRQHIPLGCDSQGRHPEAAHAACEYTDDDMPGAGAGVFVWPAVSALVILAALAAVHFWRAA